MICYNCRYWARYPNQKFRSTIVLSEDDGSIGIDIEPEYVKRMVQGGGYTEYQRERVEEAIKKYKIKGFCTYHKEDKNNDETCSGYNPINIER